jgi:hypothetical protein
LGTSKMGLIEPGRATPICLTSPKSCLIRTCRGLD